MRFRLLVAYRGDAFHGWQIQDDVRTVEGHLTDALARVTGERRKVWGASRTDAGVHARGQVAAFDYEGRVGPREMHRALNALTAEDVAVPRVDIVDPSFHPRHSARGKIYRYQIWQGFQRSPFWYDRTMHVRRALDVEAMREGASRLLGRHDFSAFRGAGCDASSPVRELFAIDIGDGPEAGVLEIRVHG
ncbi:MAG: tRNA pseudouridine synthase A, partial [Phycisphaerales bacterium]|nr:tRNA pseudouridine synthase A [Phycisphaerales bacterium]